MIPMQRTSFLLLLTACTGGPEPYYSGVGGPTLGDEAVSPDEEIGNVGGGTATITGSGFGEDASGLLVMFGNSNAEILSVSDASITVTVPSGPSTGGAVVVTVATRAGKATGRYTYEMESYTEGKDEDYPQIGYVVVNNFWESCNGGLSDRIDTSYPEMDCQALAYMGLTGTDGTAEGYSVSYPGLQSQHYGFYGGSDLGSEAWKLQRPPAAAFPSGIDGLRLDLGEVYLENPYFEKDLACVDLAGSTAYDLDGSTVYGTGSSVASLPEAVDCDGAGASEPTVRVYEKERLEFCATSDADGVNALSYVADWAVPDNFFRATPDAADPLEEVVPAEVALHVTGAGIKGTRLTLPESLLVYADDGFPEMVEGEVTPELWTGPGGSVVTLAACLTDGGLETLESVGMSFYWRPSEAVPTEVEACGTDCALGEVVAVETFVRFTINQVPLGWFGPNGAATRAVLTVPDRYQTERLDGELVSRVDVPAWVLYQIPTTLYPSGGRDGVSPTDPGAGFMVVTVERVTNYSVYGRLGDGSDGIVVMSFVTGDFGFYQWVNPLELNCG